MGEEKVLSRHTARVSWLGAGRTLLNTLTWKFEQDTERE